MLHVSRVPGRTGLRQHPDHAIQVAGPVAHASRLSAAFGVIAASLILVGSLRAEDHRNAAVLEAVREFSRPGLIEMPIGVTARGTYIWCLAAPEALIPSPGIVRAVVVAGLDGNPLQVEALQSNRDTPLLKADVPGEFQRVWIPIANPDAWYDCVYNGANPKPLEFPPKGSAYNTPGEVEAAVVNRFAEWFAPDVIVEIMPVDDPMYRMTLEKHLIHRGDQGNAVLAQGIIKPSRLAIRGGWIPADVLGEPVGELSDETQSYMELRNLDIRPQDRNGTARNALQRMQRPPLDVARRLFDTYGHKLNPVMYQPALALVARLEFSDLAGEAKHREAVRTILEPYLSGERSSLDGKSGGSHFAGHLVFAAWAHATGDERAIALVKAAADRAFDADGQPREAMPTHNEMSDAVFMACPILCEAGVLTGNPKYIDMAATHLDFMQNHCLREDGLYRHSPLCETPWGRGNGFPALGLALSLSALQPIVDRPIADSDAEDALRVAAKTAHAQMLASYRAHLQALLKHQDPTGAWRQVIDHPGAYRELTSTCMITFAIACGLRMGWLDEETYRPVVDRAWEQIQLRVYDNGELIDVCTGTGKQKSLQDYLNREAILGRDERGGAMALIAAIEMHRLLSERP